MNSLKKITLQTVKYMFYKGMFRSIDTEKLKVRFRFMEQEIWIIPEPRIVRGEKKNSGIELYTWGPDSGLRAIDKTDVPAAEQITASAKMHGKPSFLIVLNYEVSVVDYNATDNYVLAIFKLDGDYTSPKMYEGSKRN